MKETYEDFLKRIKKVSGPRKHKVSNSSGISAAILFYTKTRPRDPQYVLSRHNFSKVIDAMNLLAVESLLNNGSFKLPSGLGELKISKIKSTTYLNENDELICTKPIDRAETFRLWYEDPECYEKRALVRADSEYTFKLMHSRFNVRSKNAKYYYVKFGRDIKQKLKNRILTDKNFDAYERR
jgi:hypothetical protein